MSTVAADLPKLSAGDPFPALDADTLDGTHVSLPTVRKGEPFVVILGFSRNSGDEIERWSHALFKTLSPAVAVYGVADLSKVPTFVRGFAIGGIRKQIPASQPAHANMLLLTARNPWSALVPPGAADNAVVVGVNATGTTPRSNVDTSQTPTSQR